RLAVTEQIVTTEHAETHRETVIVIRFDDLTGLEWLRMNLERVFGFDHALTELGEFARHAGDAIGLLFARVRDAGDFRRPVEQWRDRGEREKGVGEFAEVAINGMALA